MPSLGSESRFATLSKISSNQQKIMRCAQKEEKCDQIYKKITVNRNPLLQTPDVRLSQKLQSSCYNDVQKTKVS